MYYFLPLGSFEDPYACRIMPKPCELPNVAGKRGEGFDAEFEGEEQARTGSIARMPATAEVAESIAIPRTYMLLEDGSPSSPLSGASPTSIRSWRSQGLPSRPVSRQGPPPLLSPARSPSPCMCQPSNSLGGIIGPSFNG